MTAIAWIAIHADGIPTDKDGIPDIILVDGILAGTDRSPVGIDESPAGTDRSPVGTDESPAGTSRVNFLACQFVSLWLGNYLLKSMSPKTTSPTQRHIMEVVAGVFLTMFCFGYQIVHIILNSTVCYLITMFGPRKYFHVIVFIFSISYLSITHIYRQYYDYGGYSLDVTGPLMILTQKTTIIAFGHHDGKYKDEASLSSDQKLNQIKKLPTVLEYFSYIFSFHNIMCGPLVFYIDYIKFIEGTNGMYDPPPNSQDKNGPVKVPSNDEAVKENLLTALVCGIIMVISPVIFPVSYMTADEFLYNTNWLYRNMYMLCCVSLVRAKYYTAWKLGEAVNNAAGLGFNGYDENGKAKWDLITNVKIWQLEVSNSMKVNVDSWNIQTNIWLRRIVYDRIPKYKVLSVFMISAFWHGFYPGYYIAFSTAAMITIAARLVRRNVRHHFQGSENAKFFYDCVTFICTRFCNVYMTSTFCLLQFMSSIKFFGSLYFYWNILCIAAIVIFTYVKPASRKKTEKTQ